MQSRRGVARPPILEMLVIVAAVALCRALLGTVPADLPPPAPSGPAPPVAPCLASSLTDGPVYTLAPSRRRGVRSGAAASVTRGGARPGADRSGVPAGWLVATSRCCARGLLVRIEARPLADGRPGPALPDPRGYWIDLIDLPEREGEISGYEWRPDAARTGASLGSMSSGNARVVYLHLRDYYALTGGEAKLLHAGNDWPRPGSSRPERRTGGTDIPTRDLGPYRAE